MRASELIPVISTSIAAVGHDPATKTLTVQFLSGALYGYAGVSTEDYEALLRAESIGSHFASHIKALPWKYPYTKHPGAPAGVADDTAARHDRIAVLERAHADLLARFDALEEVVYRLEGAR